MHITYYKPEIMYYTGKIELFWNWKFILTENSCSLKQCRCWVAEVEMHAIPRSGNGGQTLCYRGAAWKTLHPPALRLIKTHKSASAVVDHVGTNGFKKQQSEILKAVFSLTQVITVGPLPTPRFGDIKFSRLRQFNIWPKGYCSNTYIPFVDSSAAFSNRT